MAQKRKSVIRGLFRKRKHPAPLSIQARPLTPCEASQPSLAKLNSDTLDLLVESLHDVDPRSLNALALVCSAFYHKARYVQLRDLSLNLTKEHTDAPLGLVSESGLLSAVRTLRIKISKVFEVYLAQPNKVPADDDRLRYLTRQRSAWEQLGRLIPLMSGLRHLHWKGFALPEPVLDHLRESPQVQLHLYIKGGAPDDGGRNDPLLKNLPSRLADIPGFSELRFTLGYGYALDCRKVMADFLKPVLVSCRGIRTLALDISHPRSGCVSIGSQTEYCGIGFTNGEALPPLESLEIKGYAWGQPSANRTGANYDGYPDPDGGTEMEYWARHTDWSRLRRLCLHDTFFGSDSIDLAAHLAAQLTALEEVDFDSPFNHLHRSIPTFFSTLPRTLTSITLPDFTYSLVSPATLALHGATLRTLSIHESALPITDLAALSAGLPNLESLALVAVREADAWPLDALAVLAGFPRLEDLTLWFDVGAPEEPLKPYLTVSAVAEMFTYLRGRGAGRLRRLCAHSGQVIKPTLGLRYCLDNDWAVYNKLGFVCEMEGEGGAGGALGATRCLALDRRGNERLRRVAAGGDIAEWEERDAGFLAALRGPMPEKEWMEWTKEMWRRPRSPRRNEYKRFGGACWPFWMCVGETIECWSNLASRWKK